MYLLVQPTDAEVVGGAIDGLFLAIGTGRLQCHQQHTKDGAGGAKMCVCVCGELRSVVTPHIAMEVDWTLSHLMAMETP